MTDTAIEETTFTAEDVEDARKAGYDEGYDAGYSDGEDSSNDSAYEDGHSEGYDEGYGEGVEKAKADVIGRVEHLLSRINDGE